MLLVAFPRDRQDHISHPCHEAPGPSLEVLDPTAVEKHVQKAEQHLTARAAADTHAVSCRSAGLKCTDRNQPIRAASLT